MILARELQISLVGIFLCTAHIYFVLSILQQAKDDESTPQINIYVYINKLKTM